MSKNRFLVKPIIAAVLAIGLGVSQISLAQDVATDTFMSGVTTITSANTLPVGQNKIMLEIGPNFTVAQAIDYLHSLADKGQFLSYVGIQYNPSYMTPLNREFGKALVSVTNKDSWVDLHGSAWRAESGDFGLNKLKANIVVGANLDSSVYAAVGTAKKAHSLASKFFGVGSVSAYLDAVKKADGIPARVMYAGEVPELEELSSGLKVSDIKVQQVGFDVQDGTLTRKLGLGFLNLGATNLAVKINTSANVKEFQAGLIDGLASKFAKNLKDFRVYGMPGDSWADVLTQFAKRRDGENGIFITNGSLTGFNASKLDLTHMTVIEGDKGNLSTFFPLLTKGKLNGLGYSGSDIEGVKLLAQEKQLVKKGWAFLSQGKSSAFNLFVVEDDTNISDRVSELADHAALVGSKTKATSRETLDKAINDPSVGRIKWRGSPTDLVLAAQESPVRLIATGDEDGGKITKLKSNWLFHSM